MDQENTNQTNQADLRVSHLINFKEDIFNLLKEKSNHYGERGGFYETNSNGDYSHSIGEANLKLAEFKRTKNIRMLIKAATWIYLIYETEKMNGSK